MRPKTYANNFLKKKTKTIMLNVHCTRAQEFDTLSYEFEGIKGKYDIFGEKKSNSERERIMILKVRY